MAVIRRHELEDEKEWREVILRRGRARGIREGLSQPSVVHQNQHLVRISHFQIKATR